MNDEDLIYFVMLTTQNGGFTPMDCGEHDFELARFATKEEADAAAKNTTLGEWFGWEVFCSGHGE